MASGFPYETATYEDVPCNLCGSTSTSLLAGRDRNGLAARTVICRTCGLMFLNPRMTKPWYARYYEHEYRLQMARFRGRREEVADFDALFSDAERKGRILAAHLRDGLAPGFTVEVGSGVGGTLFAFKSALGLPILGIEPSAAEASYAASRGIPTHASLFEDFREPIPMAANIMSLRNLNHLLDPRAFFAWAWERLAPNGRIILMVQDFRLLAKKMGSIERAAQIDHTYMFVPEVLAEFVGAAGFDTVRFETHERTPFRNLLRPETSELAGGRMLLVAAKTDRRPFPDGMRITPNYRRVSASLAPFRLALSSSYYRLLRRLLV